MRVFIAEDQVKLARGIKRGLEHQGFAVDTIAHGGEAFEHLIIHYKNYDVIVLDLMLPGRGGLDICRSLRERNISTPILVLTARSETADKVVLLNAGADDYLTKPFSFAELIARLQALMRRPDVVLPTELTVGYLRLDPGAHRVFLEEVELKFTAKEFAQIGRAHV